MRPGSQPCLARPARSRLTRAVSPLVQDTTRAFTSVLELLHDDESFYRQRYYKALADNDDKGDNGDSHRDDNNDQLAVSREQPCPVTTKIRAYSRSP